MKFTIPIGMRLVVYVMALTSLLTGCHEPSGYEQMLERELASGERNDSLFLGLYLGMSSKDFYMHCWEMNKEGLVRQGSRNTTVAYQMKDELPHAAVMDFYPTFREDRIVEMPVVVHYTAWSPWNRNLWADSLQVDMVHLLEGWHGKGFIKVKHPKKGVAYVKMDGNRRIVVAALDDQDVRVLYTDMSVDRSQPPVAPASGPEN